MCCVMCAVYCVLCAVRVLYYAYVDSPPSSPPSLPQVLAWANSIGDFVADTAVARAGRPKMGVASTFGSPLLTACLGLGFATVIASASTGSVMSHINGEYVNQS